MQQLSLLEMLTYSTVRIECVSGDGNMKLGTGFLFMFLPNEKGEGQPAIITNKHVIEGATSGRVFFSKVDSSGNIIDNEVEVLPLNNLKQIVHLHPDKGVDLCAIPIGVGLNWLRASGKECAVFTMDARYVHSSPGARTDLDAVEEVLMIGYPAGLWDYYNNKPVVRRGITATHPLKDYLGKKEFMIDAFCVEGSSGSPVFIYNSGIRAAKFGGTNVGEKAVELLGIMYGGPKMNTAGQIIARDRPEAKNEIVISPTPLNLGHVIKAERILELEKLFLPKTYTFRK